MAVALGVASSANATLTPSYTSTQTKLLKADLAHEACVARCAIRGPACTPGCERALQRKVRSVFKPFGGHLVRHLKASANQLWFDTGIDLPEDGCVSIVALGKWSVDARPLFAPAGIANTKNFPGVIDGRFDVGSLLASSGSPGARVFKVADASGTVCNGAPVFTPGGRLYLAMNDAPWGFYDNQGTLDVSVLTIGGSKVHLGISARDGWTNTHVFMSPNRMYYIEASGLWSNSGPPGISADGFQNYPFPGTVLPSADLASLIASVDTTAFQVGSWYWGYFPEGGPIYLGMNDVWGTFGDNQGTLSVVISDRSWDIVL